MNAPSSSFLATLRWMAAQVHFPSRRMPEASERLLLMVAAATDLEMQANEERGGMVQRRDPAKDASMRAHAMRRSMVHYRCDNGAKV